MLQINQVHDRMSRVGSFPGSGAPCNTGLQGMTQVAQARFDELWLALQDLDRMSDWRLDRLKRRHDATLAAAYSSTSWRLTRPLRGAQAVYAVSPTHLPADYFCHPDPVALPKTEQISGARG